MVVMVDASDSELRLFGELRVRKGRRGVTALIRRREIVLGRCLTVGVIPVLTHMQHTELAVRGIPH